MRQPTDIIRDPLFLAGNFCSLESKRGWVHWEPFEPLTEALKVAGASRAELHGPHTLGANFHMQCPLLNRDFTVWALPPRRAQYGDWRYWRLGIRLGENASGAWSQRATKLSSHMGSGRRRSEG